MLDKERIKDMIEEMCEPDCIIAKKALDYYDGDQLEYVIAQLNDPKTGRKDWQSRFVPRARNIVKTIVDKSGLLFSGNAPSINVQVDNTTNEQLSSKLLTEFNKAEWVEFFTNFDNMVRLLRSGLVLVQYVGDGLKFDALHKGNAYIERNRITKQIELLLMKTEEHNDCDIYRLFTLTDIVDFSWGNDKATLLESNPNTYGCVPVAMFHDTHTPRYETWNEVPQDLVGLNDAYNFHLIDLEYAAAFGNRKMLFSNCDIIGATPASTFNPVNTENAIGSSIQRKAIMSPDSIAKLEAPSGSAAPYLEFKGPEINPQPSIDMFRAWIKDFAYDWCVDVTYDGDGGATSGFQLVVQQLDNIELRNMRQRMMEAGFKRLYRVVAKVFNSVKPGYFSEDADLFVEFSKPDLPVDEKASEEMWSLRIKEGRASRVDYFMATQGMTKDEAEAKVAEVDGYTLRNIAKSTPLAKVDSVSAILNG